MKNASKITRIKLKTGNSPEPVILGIVSPEPDYKLSLSLNRKLGISLRNIAPVEIRNETESELTFSRFSDQSASDGLIYDLVSNRSGNNCFFRKLKNIDFIFQIFHFENESDINRILKAIREIEHVTGVFRIKAEAAGKEKNVQLIAH